jgi:GNAT superfamily N-acetyltransferase
MTKSVVVRPVTASRWEDVAAFAGARGFSSSCWCMWWRLTSKEFDRPAGVKRKEFKRLVEANRVPGLLAYVGREPAGWCSVAPRSEFGRVERSPNLKPVDEAADVWALVCFYVHRRQRGGGVARALLNAAIERAQSKRAMWLEAYPIDTAVAPKKASSELFTGTLKMFEEAGFTEIARRSPARPIVRLKLRD